MHIREVFDTAPIWTQIPCIEGVCEIYVTHIGSSEIQLDYDFRYDKKENVLREIYVEFSRDSQREITGQGMQNQIFGAVFNHIKNTAQKYKPLQLTAFSALPKPGQRGPDLSSRSRLYLRMGRMLASQLGYSVLLKHRSDGDMFILRRDST